MLLFCILIHFVIWETSDNLVSSKIVKRSYTATTNTTNGITLAFAIDNTGSMGDDINQVRIALTSIINHVRERKQHPVVDYVFSTFNDPDPPITYKTTDIEQFQRKLNEIKIDGGGDCPELSMSGIKAAIDASLNHSIVYVFTDASAKDMDILGEEVVQLAKRKNMQVTFLLTGECRGRNDAQYLIYERLASENMGQVYHIHNKKELGKVLIFLAESLNDKTKIIASGKAKIEDKDTDTGRYEKEMFIDVDESMKSFTVIVNGMKPKIIIKNPTDEVINESQIQTKVDMPEILVKQVINPKQGRWMINSSSSTPHSIEIKTVSGIDFLYGFSFSPVKSLDKTVENPFQKTKSYLTLTPIIEDSETAWNPKTVHFIDLSGNQIEGPIRLSPVFHSKNLFQTSKFLVPNQQFYIAVSGYDALGNGVKRISKAPIEPQKLNNKETIRDGKWSEWSDWTKCSVSCGIGIQLKYRVCNNPQPLNGGSYCEGSYKQQRQCIVDPCPINGGWSKWGNWTKCSASCGKGLKTRYRRCTNPAPMYGGNPCIGENFTTELCELKLCNPERIILRVKGYVNGEKINEKNITVDVINELKRNTTTLRIMTDDILRTRSKSTWSPIYPFIMSSVAWVFANELGNSSNGLTLSRGNFHQISNIHFHSGEKLNLRHNGNGVSSAQTLIIDINLQGEVPIYAKKSKIVMAPNNKILLQIGPGQIYVKQTLIQKNSTNTIGLGYDLVEIFEYSDTLGTMPFVRQSINQSEIQTHFTSDPNTYIFSTDSSIGSAKTQKCPSGYTLIGMKYCSDVDECDLKTNYCSHNCKNLMGTYECFCPNDMELNVDGKTCIEIKGDSDYSSEYYSE